MKNRSQVRGSRFQEERPAQDGEQGYMLLGLIVAIFLILLALSVAASDMAQTIRRERERESARRANQYVRAIRLFYLKNGNRYPPNVKALENTNMVRFLRQEYTDPLTGKDYRLIIVGQNKTTPTGFFGAPLGGIASAGLGSAAGMQSTGMGNTPGAAGTPGVAGTPEAAGATGAAGGASSASGTTSSGLQSTPFTTGPFGSPTGSGGSGPIMGVGTDAKGNSILIVNQQTTYDMWEFLYDPRTEKLRAQAALNAGMGSVNAGALGGQTPGANGVNNNTNPNSPTTPGNSTNPTGPNGGASPTGGASPIGP